MQEASMVRSDKAQRRTSVVVADGLRLPLNDHGCHMPLLQCANLRRYVVLPNNSIQHESLRLRLLPFRTLAAATSAAIYSPCGIPGNSMFANTCRSSSVPSCPKACSCSVEVIRLLRDSFLSTTDQPGMPLSSTKKTCKTSASLLVCITVKHRNPLPNGCGETVWNVTCTPPAMPVMEGGMDSPDRVASPPCSPARTRAHRDAAWVALPCA